MSANQGLDDPWVVEPEKNLLLPQRHLLPRAKREGVIVNKGDLRLYYFIMLDWVDLSVTCRLFFVSWASISLSLSLSISFYVYAL